MSNVRRRELQVTRLAKVLWAAPCSVVGLGLAAVVVMLGGRAAYTSGTLEVVFPSAGSLRSRLVHCLPFQAIAIGHVIIAAGGKELEHSRRHERVHVRQYERWGILFFVAYPLSSLWQLLRGRRAYWDNHFEVQARQLSATPSTKEPVA